MGEWDPELVCEVVRLITEKKWYDYLQIFFSISAPLLAVGLSFFYFNKQHLQNAKILIMEKDIERLYDAADLFFDFSDSMGLFISMTADKSRYLLSNEVVPSTVDTKSINAAETVFNKFSSIYKSYFLLRSLGENDVASQIQNYREDTIKFRKEIVDIAKFKKGDVYPSNLNSHLLLKMEEKKASFMIERNKCLDNIALCKKSLKMHGPRSR